MRQEAIPIQRSSSMIERVEVGTQPVDRLASRKEEEEWEPSIRPLQQEVRVAGKKNKTYDRIASTKNTAEDSSWKAPDDSREILELMVKVRDATQALQTQKEVIKDGRKDIGDIRGMMPMNDGRVVLRFSTKEQMHKVTRML